MNYANLQQTEITLYGNGRSIMICPVPAYLKQNLIPKRVAVQDYYMTMKSIPKFIPKIVSLASLNYAGGAFNTNGNNIPLVQYNVTDYFINCRTFDNSDCYTAFVIWTNPTGASVPFGQYTQSDVERSPFFYSYNVMDFVQMVQTAINLALENALGASPSSLCAFTYSVESDTFNFSIPETYSNGYKFEISPALKELFNFETTRITLGTFITHQIIWSPLLESINGIDYVNSSCKGSTQLFPFDRIMLTTNLPITPVTILTSNMQSVGYGNEIPVLFMVKHFNEKLGSDIDIADKNTNMIERAKTFTQQTHTDANLTFNVILRSRMTGNLMEWALLEGDVLQLTLNTYNLL